MVFCPSLSIEASKSRKVHFLRITHRDEVEPPITDWLHEAYESNVAPVSRAPATTARKVAGKPERNAPTKKAAVKVKPKQRKKKV